MRIWPTRRRIIFAVTLFASGLMGVGIFSLLVRSTRLGTGFPLAALGLTALSPCKDGLIPWARSLVANRAALGDDDFAVEAAVALALLRDRGAEQLSSTERQELNNAASRCPSVLHVPCDDAKFELAVARRCSPPKRRAHQRDAGAAPCPDAAPNGD